MKQETYICIKGSPEIPSGLRALWVSYEGGYMLYDGEVRLGISLAAWQVEQNPECWRKIENVMNYDGKEDCEKLIKVLKNYRQETATGIVKQQLREQEVIWEGKNERLVRVFPNGSSWILRQTKEENRLKGAKDEDLAEQKRQESMTAPHELRHMCLMEILDFINVDLPPGGATKIMDVLERYI